MDKRKKGKEREIENIKRGEEEADIDRVNFLFQVPQLMKDHWCKMIISVIGLVSTILAGIIVGIFTTVYFLFVCFIRCV